VHCGNAAESLQTIVVLYGTRGASSAPCGAVHLVIIAVHYGDVTESLQTTGMLADHCSALQCITAHCGSFADHCNDSKPLQFTTMHCGASSARCGGVHHTLTEMPKFHPPPLSSG